jgi:BMFP domain-containing protein YqiC
MSATPSDRLTALVRETLGAQMLEMLQQRVEVESLHARIKELEAEIAQKKDA